MKHLKGRVAVVTGAASGIGLAMAKQFVGEGMKLVLADIEETSLARVLEELRASALMTTQIPPLVATSNFPTVSAPIGRTRRLVRLSQRHLSLPHGNGLAPVKRAFEGTFCHSDHP